MSQETQVMSFLDRARLQISTNIKKLPSGHAKTMQAESGGPQARQGRIYKPTIRSKLNPKRSYNSTGAFWWAYHPMLLLVGFQRINRPGNHITVCWLSSLGECTRQMMWGRSHGDIGGVGGYVEFPPTTTPSPPPAAGVVACHWSATAKIGGGRGVQGWLSRAQTPER